MAQTENMNNELFTHQPDYAGFEEPLIYGSYESKLYMRAFSLICLVSLVFGLVFYSLYQARMDEHREVALLKSKKNIGVYRQSIVNEWETVARQNSDIVFELEEHFPEGRDGLEALNGELLPFVSSNPVYQTLTIINADQIELLRISRLENGGLSSVFDQSSTYSIGVDMSRLNKLAPKQFLVAHHFNRDGILLFDLMSPIFIKGAHVASMIVSISAEKIFRFIPVSVLNMGGSLYFIDDQVQWIYDSRATPQIHRLSKKALNDMLEEELRGYLLLKNRGVYEKDSEDFFEDKEQGFVVFDTIDLMMVFSNRAVAVPTWRVLLKYSEADLEAEAAEGVGSFMYMLVSLLLLLAVFCFALAWRWELQLRTQFLLIQEGSRMRHLAEATRMIPYQLELDHKVWRPVYYDQAIMLILGYAPEDFLDETDRGYKDWWLGLIHANEWRTIRDSYFELAHATTSQSYSLSYRIRHKQGHYLWIRDNGQAVVAHGKVLGALGWWLDIDEDKRAALERMNSTGNYAKSVPEIHLIDDKLCDKLQLLCKETGEKLQLFHSSIWQINGEATALKCITLYTPEGRKPSDSEIRSENYPDFFEALMRLKIIDANDAAHDPRTSEFNGSYLQTYGISSMLIIPIHVDDVLWGAMFCEHGDTLRRWSGAELGYCQDIAVWLEKMIKA